MGPTELATSSFGQGYNMTMIQEAAAFSSVINGGYYYKPHVVKKILDSNGGTVENIKPINVQIRHSFLHNILKNFLGIAAACLRDMIRSIRLIHHYITDYLRIVRRCKADKGYQRRFWIPTAVRWRISIRCW